MDHGNHKSDLQRTHQSHQPFDFSLLPLLSINDEEDIRVNNILPTRHSDRDPAESFAIHHRFSTLDKCDHFTFPLKESVDYYLKDPSHDQPIHFPDIPTNNNGLSSQNEFFFNPDNEEYESEDTTAKNSNDEIEEENSTDELVDDCSKVRRQLKTPWSKVEIQHIIELANKMIDEGKFCFLNLAELYVNRYPGRTVNAVSQYARKLLAKNEIISSNQVKGKTMSYWSEEEKQDLIKTAHEMIDEGKFCYDYLAELYLKKNPGRTANAVSFFAKKLLDSNGIVLPNHIKRKTINYWSEEEKQNLIELAIDMTQKGIFNAVNLAEDYIKKYPGRTTAAVQKFAKKLLDNNEIILPNDIKRKSNNNWPEAHTQRLLQIAQGMIDVGKSDLEEIAKTYSAASTRSITSVLQMLHKLINDGEIRIGSIDNLEDNDEKNSESLRRKFWSESDKQNLIEFAQEWIGRLSYTNIAKLFLQRYPGRTINSVKEFIRKLLRGNQIPLPANLIGQKRKSYN